MNKQGYSPLSPKDSKRSRPSKGETGETSLTISKEKVKKILSEKELPCPHLRRNTSILRGRGGLYNMVECLDCGEILETKPKIDKTSSNQQPQINPEDYLRTLTEGCVKPGLDFIWTYNADELARMEEGKPEIEKPKKVYCKDCKYFGSSLSSYNPYNECNKIIRYDSTPQKKYPIYAGTDVHNLKNNCEYYSEKWYIKLWRMFK